MTAVVFVLLWLIVLALIVWRLHGWRDRRAAVADPRAVRCIRMRSGAKP